MSSPSLAVAILVLLASGLIQAQSSANNELTITTNTGTYTGIINGTAPHVRQFLNIAYAVPPVGKFRWLPPRRVTSPSTTRFDATQYGPSCPQFISKIPFAYTEFLPQVLPVYGAENSTAGLFAQTSAEDCLSLAIWTPTGNVKDLPVIMFITGGGFVFNGINVPIQLPYHWVERTRKHIVVTINYRLNIFGFPNARGLSSQNLGLLDQRMALEWVSENIAAFGGDPKKITTWVRALDGRDLHEAYFYKGQSAGSTSVDFHNFAFPSDPIAAGFFMSSGTALLPNIASSDHLHSNFTFVASHLGCGGLNASGEVSCMRKVSVADIENFVGQYQDNSSLINNSQPPVRFTPVPDGILVFSNYTDRYAKGALSKRPAIISSTADEGTLLVPVPDDPITTSANQTAANAITIGLFVCPAANSSVLRARHGLTTYRSQFAGNFSNVSPLWWLGAYHTSDLQMLFGTYQDYVGLGGEGSTPIEIATSNVMQDFVLAFMEDPVHGPPKIGWPTFANGGMLRFGADGKAVQSVSINAVDGVCYNQQSYDYNP